MVEQYMREYPVGAYVTVGQDDDHPEENGRVIWHSPEDPMLYVVLVNDPLSETDHRHRLVAGDVIIHAEVY